MIPYARVFESEQKARDAVSKLAEGGISADAVLLIGPGAGADAVKKAIDEERLPYEFLNVGPQELEKGHTIVAVRAALGRGKPVVDALDACGPVEVTFPKVTRNSPSPLSDLLGLPVLSDPKSYATLSDHDAFTTDWFMSLLTKSQKPWFGTLSKPKKNWKSSFGFPLLTRTGGPVLPGKLLSPPPKDWRSSFGYALLAEPNRRYRRRLPDRIPYVRVYATEENARGAVSKLLERGVPDRDVLLIEPSAGASAIARGIDDQRLPLGFRGVGEKALAAGRYVVSVRSAFGQGVANRDILDAFEPLDVKVPEVSASNPSPFSDFIGMPVLALSRSNTSLSKLTYYTGFIGLLTSGKPLIGGLSKPKKNWTSSLGMPLLTKDGKPFFGGLSSPKKNWTRSFGFPLLSKNPAPLSSLLGIKTLTDETKNKNDDGNRDLRV